MSSINTNSTSDVLQSAGKLREIHEAGKKAARTNAGPAQQASQTTVTSLAGAEPPESQDRAGEEVAPRLAQLQSRAAHVSTAPVGNADEANGIARWAALQMERQPAVAMAAQANQSPAAVLALLRA